MSDELFPLSLISGLRVTKVDRTLLDEFESGKTSTRYYWPQFYFKRKLELTTNALTLSEFKYLRSFYHQRGTWDSFWIRDNVGRDGNISVRFAAPFPMDRDPVFYNLSFQLEEVAPIRALPGFDEITAAAGTAPLLGYDPNREIYLYDRGTATVDPSTWDIYETYRGVWSGSGLNLGGYASQYQYFKFAGGNKAATASNISALATTKPGCTVFVFCKASTSAAQCVLLAVGGTANNGCMGIILDSDNYFKPYIGGNGTWANSKYQNSAANQWRSICVTFQDSGDNTKLYHNATLQGTDSQARSYSAGAAFLGQDPSGGKVFNVASALTNAWMGQAFVIPAELSAAQVKALHNLLCYQYGLAVVP